MSREERIASSLENNCGKGIHIQTDQALGFVDNCIDFSRNDLEEY
jgi:hypothetical protein